MHKKAALKWLFETEGAEFELVYLPVDRATQLERIQRRWAHMPHETFPVTVTELDYWRALFEMPEAAELAGIQLPGPPPGWATWGAWAQDRWPSLSID